MPPVYLEVERRRLDARIAKLITAIVGLVVLLIGLFVGDFGIGIAILITPIAVTLAVGGRSPEYDLWHRTFVRCPACGAVLSHNPRQATCDQCKIRLVPWRREDESEDCDSSGRG